MNSLCINAVSAIITNALNDLDNNNNSNNNKNKNRFVAQALGTTVAFVDIVLVVHAVDINVLSLILV